MKGFTVRLAFAAAALTGLLTVGAAPSLANHVQCGDVLTANTTLDADLDCTGSNHALDLAPNVSLNLGRHTVRVGGSPGLIPGHDPYPPPPPGGGIRVSDGATVENGRVEGRAVMDGFGGKQLSCAVGIHGEGSIHSATIHRVRIRNCSTGIYISGGVRYRILDNEVLEFSDSDEDNHFGIFLEFGEHPLPDTTANTISGNVVYNSALAPQPWEEPGHFPHDYGIYIEVGRDDVVERNVTSGNQLGIYVLGKNLVGKPGTVVERNLATRSCGEAMYLILHHGRAIRNEARAEGPLCGPGIGVWTGGQEMLFERNSASGFRFAGIYVDRPGATLRKNRADDNGEWGIQAVEGTIDGGGNKARGNGNPAQCLNVFCK